MKESRRESIRLVLEVIGIISILISLYYTRVSIASSNESVALTRKSLDLARESQNTSNEGLAWNRKMAIAAVRPALTITNFATAPTILASSTRQMPASDLWRVPASCTLKNVSSSTALNIVVEAIGKTGPPRKGAFGIAALPQGEDINFGVMFEFPDEKSAELTAKPPFSGRRDTEIIVSYEDIFGTKYRTRFLTDETGYEDLDNEPYTLSHETVKD